MRSLQLIFGGVSFLTFIIVGTSGLRLFVFSRTINITSSGKLQNDFFLLGIYPATGYLKRLIRNFFYGKLEKQ